MSKGKLEENVAAVIKNAASCIPQKWANIASISVKTGQSVALPVYNKTREELESLAKMAEVNMNNTISLDKKRVLESDQKDEEIKEKKQRKEKLAAKSPLVKALKKQKVLEKEDDSLKKAEKKRSGSVDSEGKSKKKKKRSESVDSEGKSKKRSEAVDISDEKNIEPKKKASFIASKKFKGSKKGYVFKRGNEGNGYYIDSIPKPDLLALDALARANKVTPKKGRSSSKGRRKSSGKRYKR